MFKKILIAFIIFLNLICLAYAPCIPAGTLVKVFTKIPLSTQNLEEGSRVYFIAPADVWVLEQKAISKGDILKGYVSHLTMPILGVNASMQINIDRIKKVDGTTQFVQARLIFGSKDTLGGDLTNPASYNKTIHPKRVYGNNWGGTLQYVPSGEYEFGQHVGINSRDSLFVEFLEDYYF